MTSRLKSRLISPGFNYQFLNNALLAFMREKKKKIAKGLRCVKHLLDAIRIARGIASRQVCVSSWVGVLYWRRLVRAVFFETSTLKRQHIMLAVEI